MARSCGLRIGPRRFELVVLEGGPKKHRITAWMTGDLPLVGAGKSDGAGGAAAGDVERAGGDAAVDL